MKSPLSPNVALCIKAGFCQIQSHTCLWLHLTYSNQTFAALIERLNAFLGTHNMQNAFKFYTVCLLWCSVTVYRKNIICIWVITIVFPVVYALQVNIYCCNVLKGINKLSLISVTFSKKQLNNSLLSFHVCLQIIIQNFLQGILLVSISYFIITFMQSSYHILLLSTVTS